MTDGTCKTAEWTMLRGHEGWVATSWATLKGEGA